MKTYLDMDEVLRHCRRYIGQEYDEPYLVSAVPEEVIRSLPAADVVERKKGDWINERQEGLGSFSAECSLCGKRTLAYFHYFYCPNCGADMREATT